MTASTYDAACNLIQGLALKDGIQCLVDREINPFFLIYACADCNVPLPKNFDRELLWKHLDGIIRTKCWRGLRQTRANTQYLKGTNADGGLFQKEVDPDGTLQSLMAISCEIDSSRGRSFNATRVPTAGQVPRTVHRLQITIEDYKWVAKAPVGTVWYRAGDLHDEDDIACFAVIDCLTRLLPSYEGCILDICSDHFPLLWGVGGAPKGAWPVVQAICKEYRVKLRAKWTALRGPGPSRRIEEGFTVPPRDRDVVNAALNEFTQNQLGSKAAYKCMMADLRHVST